MTDLNICGAIGALRQKPVFVSDFFSCCFLVIYYKTVEHAGFVITVSLRAAIKKISEFKTSKIRSCRVSVKHRPGVTVLLNTDNNVTVKLMPRVLVCFYFMSYAKEGWDGLFSPAWFDS